MSVSRFSAAGQHSNTWRPRIMASILRVNTLTDASSNNSTAMSYC